MPTDADCKRRAESDRKLADDLTAVGHLNWAVTALFYACVHQVNRLKVRDGCYRDDGTHGQTLDYLDRSHPGARASYVALMGKSRRTRYEVGFEADLDNVARAIRFYDRLADYVDRAVSGQIPGV